jgi:sulfonate transport system substrate-binding protein
MLEDEFRKEGIQITWSFLRGAGPAVNELFANGLLDFSALGDLPSIVGRASGLQYGLTQKDVRLINMDVPTATAAIVTGDIDAAFGGSQYLGLRDQGAARILYRTTGGEPKYTSDTTFLGSSSFIQKYPEITRRVLKTHVLAAKWLADQEAEPEPVFQLWTRTGFTFASFKEDWTNESMKYKTSPLIDPYIYSRYAFQISEARRLTRGTFDFNEWVEPSFLKRPSRSSGCRPSGLRATRRASRSCETHGALTRCRQRQLVLLHTYGSMIASAALNSRAWPASFGC